MKRTILSAITLIILVFVGCSEPGADLIGTWVKGADTVRIIAGGEFEVDIDSNGSLEVWGTYDITKTMITFVDDLSSPSACAGSVPGEYSYTVTNTQCTLGLINDSCSGRAGMIPGTYLAQ